MNSEPELGHQNLVTHKNIEATFRHRFLCNSVDRFSPQGNQGIYHIGMSEHLSWFHHVGLILSARFSLEIYWRRPAAPSHVVSGALPSQLRFQTPRRGTIGNFVHTDII